MKKIIVLFSIILACVFAGCDKSNVTDENVQDGDCLVTINPIGEISTSESPMTKASSSTNDIYLVQVYKGTDSYAIGYFDNLESMRLYLKQGSSYEIIVAMVKDAKTLLGSRYNASQNSINNSYEEYDTFDFRFCPSDFYKSHLGNNIFKSGVPSSFPYYYNTNNRSDTGNETTNIQERFYPLNLYQYCFKEELSYFETSSAKTLTTSRLMDKYLRDSNTQLLYFYEINNGKLNEKKYPNCTDWFYGKVDSFTPSGRYETLNMNFKRVGFKLKYELSGVTDGEVTVKIYNKRSDSDISTFFENTSNTSTYTSETKFFAFYDTKSAWQYAENYSEKVLVNVVWKRSNGVTQELGEKSVTIKRNCLNNIKIALGSDDKGAGMNMSTEAEDWSERNSTDITVQ